MKLLSLWEPWATLMALGQKRIETRSWSTPYRGWLAIHASKGGLPKATIADVLSDPMFKAALDGESLSPGCIVAVVHLIDCLPMESRVCLPGVFDDYPKLDTPQEREFGNFGEGRWAWVTDCVFRLAKPIPFRGKQGLVDVPHETLLALRENCRPKAVGKAVRNG